MNGAGEMIVIDTKFPDPDSQFRLRLCGCSQEHWAVRCFGCGTTTDPFLIRHDAQIFWNTKMAVTPRRNFSYEQS